MPERTVVIGGEPVSVVTLQRSKAAWIGSYMGRRIEVKGSSEASALVRWREAARFRAR